MSNAWDHLPNAKYIDAVIVSVKAHPDEWVKTCTSDLIESEAEKAISIMYGIENRYNDASEAWEQIKVIVRFFGKDIWRMAVRYAIICLFSYDDSGYMLESDPGELEILAKLGDSKAILLLPACKALALIKEKENV